MREEMQEYLLALKGARNLSRNTLRAYEADLREFSDFAAGEGVDGISAISRSLVRAYIGFIQERRPSRNTLLRKISSLRSFISYLFAKGRLKADPFSMLRSPRREKKLPRFMTEAEMEKLMDYNRPVGRGERGKRERDLRDFAILVFMYSTGLRRSEVVSLNVGDVDFLGGTVRVFGKGSRERIVPVGDNALEVLREYLETRGIPDSGGEPLFLNSRGGRLSDSGLALVVRRMARKARFSRHITAHSIRHSFATHLLDRGCDLKSVQEMLGHKNLATTEIYTHVSLEKLRKVYDKSHPRAKKGF